MKIYNVRDDRDSEDYPINPDEDIYYTSASAYDCTGLIPTPPEDEAQQESYGDIYPQLPIDI